MNTRWKAFIQSMKISFFPRQRVRDVDVCKRPAQDALTYNRALMPGTPRSGIATDGQA